MVFMSVKKEQSPKVHNPLDRALEFLSFCLFWLFICVKRSLGFLVRLESSRFLAVENAFVSLFFITKL